MKLKRKTLLRNRSVRSTATYVPRSFLFSHPVSTEHGGPVKITTARGEMIELQPMNEKRTLFVEVLKPSFEVPAKDGSVLIPSFSIEKEDHRLGCKLHWDDET